MTVTATNRKNQFTTNGVTVDFAFNFAITDIQQVFALTILNDVETEYTNFTIVESISEEGGTLTTGDILDGVDLLVFRDTSLTQQVNYVNGGRFPANSHEQALDKLTLQSQDQQEEIDRSLKSSISDELPFQLGTLEEGKLLAVVGDLIETVDASISDAETFVEYADYSQLWVESSNQTETSPLGQVQRTIFSIGEEGTLVINDIETRGNEALGALGGVDIGFYNTDPQFNNLNEFCKYDRAGTIESYKLNPATPLPYTPDSAGTPDPQNDSNLVMFNDVTREYVNQNFDKFGTLSSFVNDPKLTLGMAVRVTDRGDGFFDVVTGETPNGFNIVDHATLSLQLKLREVIGVKSVLNWGFDDSISASNDIVVGLYFADVKDGDTLDFAGKMFRVFDNTTGIPSSGADPAIDRAQPLTEMAFLDSKKNITFGKGGIYAADQGSTGTKSYFPSTLYLKGCEGVHFEAGSIFESKGENWGDSDASLPLTFEERQDFVGQNGGHAIVAVRCFKITGSPEGRLCGSVGALYFPSCAEVNLESPFSNSASLGYASYNFDGWCGNIAETGFVSLGGHMINPRAHAETILRREDGVQAGSSIYCGKGGIITEDRNMVVTAAGGSISDMFANGGNKRLGYAQGAGSGSKLVTTGLLVRNCQEVIFTNWSVDEVSECIAYDVDAVVGLTGVMIDSQSFGSADITMTGKVRVNNSRLWLGEVEQLATTSLVASLKPSSPAFVTLNVDAAGDENPPPTFEGGIFSLIQNNTVATYGEVVITGGVYETSGYLIRSVGWGSPSGLLTGLIIADGVLIKDVNAVASDEYIKYTNVDAFSSFTYIYHDIKGAIFQLPNNFRKLDGYIIAGSGLVTKIALPQRLDDAYISNPAYRKKQNLTLEWTSNTGLSGPDTLANFVLEDSTAIFSNGFIQTDEDALVKCLSQTTTIAGPQRAELLLVGDVRTEFTISTSYNYFGG